MIGGIDQKYFKIHQDHFYPGLYTKINGQIYYPSIVIITLIEDLNFEVV